MNEQIIKGRWKEFTGEIQKAWGKLTNDELAQANGNLKVLSGLIQKRYGIAQDEASSRVRDLASRFTSEYSPPSTDTPFREGYPEQSPVAANEIPRSFHQ